MPLQNRQTQQYLIAAAILVPVILALYFVARWTQNQDIGVYTHNRSGIHEMIVMKRDGSYEHFRRSSPGNSVSVERGKWTVAPIDSPKSPRPPEARPERFLNFTSEQGKTTRVSKARFEKPNAQTSLEIEKARQAVGRQ